MKVLFEHRVEVSPALIQQGFSRESLWLGLVLYANEPALFIPEIDKVVVDEPKSDDDIEFSFNREIIFPQFVVEDTVTLDDGFSVRIDVKAGATWPASRLTLEIDEDQKPQLAVRFKYEEDEDAYADEPEVVHTLRRQAYETKDRRLVKQIETLYTEGELL